MTEFHVLGPVEVEDGGRRTMISSAKARALLGLLLVQANTAVGVDALTDQLWSGCPPAQATAALRVHISHLRKALQAVDSADRLVTRPGGYLLLVMPEELDAQRFATLAEQGRVELAEQRAPEALATLRKAERLWRGEAFADVAAMASVDAERVRLKEQRLTVVEARIDAELACGRHAWVVAELEHLTTTHPLRERLWEQRIVALYRCGRQADALAAYGTVRALLDTDLGLHPGPGLTRLQTSILRQDPRLDWQPVTARCSSSFATCVHTAGWIAAPTPVRTAAEVGQSAAAEVGQKGLR